MFNKIPHPHTGKMYPTLSPEGKSILEKYKNELKQNQESVEFPSGPPPQPFQNGGTGLTTSSAPISINLPGTIPGLPPSPKSNESYLQTFFKDVKVQPSCSNTQLKELGQILCVGAAQWLSQMHSNSYLLQFAQRPMSFDFLSNTLAKKFTGTFLTIKQFPDHT